MAKARDLAALAGLGALAYAMRNKNKPEQENKGRQSEDAGYKSTETREDKAADDGYKNDVLKTITQKREGPNDQAGNQGVLDGNKPAPKPAPKLAPKLETYTTRKDPREAEAGMSRGTRKTSMAGAGRGFVNPPVPAPTASTVSSSEEGMKNYAPRKPIYRQETQQERAERYVAKRRAAQDAGMKKGGMVSKVSSASKRADGIASRGKTKCKMY